MRKRAFTAPPVRVDFYGENVSSANRRVAHAMAPPRSQTARYFKNRGRSSGEHPKRELRNRQLTRESPRPPDRSLIFRERTRKT